MAKQLSLPLRRRGGKRPRAGRKPVGDRAGTPHRPREAFSAARPVLVTKRVLPFVWSLRRRDTYAVIRRAISETNFAGRIGIVHYAVLGNHLHLIVEADDSVSLARGLQGLWVRMAKQLNQLMGRRGTVFADRFHSRVLESPRQVRNGLAYVLCNARRHRVVRAVSRMWVDPFSSAPDFDGWTRKVTPVGPGSPTVPAMTWLLERGWRRHGLLDPAYVPG